MFQIFKMCPIGKDEILAGGLQTISRLIENAEMELVQTRQIDPLNVTVSDYDLDPRSLNEIPEVKEWFIKIQTAFPYFPIFLSQFSLNQYMLAQLELRTVSTGLRENMSNLEKMSVDDMVSLYEKAHPGEGDEFRKQLEYENTYSVDTAALQALLAEIRFAAMLYLTTIGIKGEEQQILLSEAFERITSSLQLG